MESFVLTAIRERPRLFSKATYFAAHPYPSQEWAPLNNSANFPVELNGTSGWMAEVKNLRYLVADSWATNSSHDKNALLNATAFRLLATETGWGGHDDAMKTNSMVQAFQQLWDPDPVVAGVVPFLLTGQHWDSYGKLWIWSYK